MCTFFTYLHSYLIPRSLILLFLLITPFVVLSFYLGLLGLSEGLINVSELNRLTWRSTNDSLSLHMITGSVLTSIAPLQFLRSRFQKARVLHRVLGYIVVSLAFLTCIGGIIYIVIHGTRGGLWMNMGFGIYGAFLVLSAFFVVYYARKENLRLHEEWGLRFILLSLGSWFYRVCYGVLIFIDPTCPGHTIDFRGPFDFFMNFAFYLLPLLFLEIYLRVYKMSDTQYRLWIFTLNFFLFIGTYGFYKVLI
ncbi:MAG: DUF2306 domain-containing protein [Waddliaceae bacterium]|nr:DUF2306 domain-containing protein [Waddliaceae bacterium]